MRWKPLLALLAALITVPPGAAAEVEIDRSRSIFAVVTHRGGLGAALAHDHLVVAAVYEARLAFDPAAPLGAIFGLELEAENLEVDRRDLQQAWYPRLEQLGVLDDTFGEVSEKDRGKIRAAMLSAKQLHGREFPRIAARIVGLEEKASAVGEVAFPYSATLALEVRGRTVERAVAARFELAGGRLTVEAVGTFRFTDFGIKPYSVALGLIRNLDEFQVYVYLDGALEE